MPWVLAAQKQQLVGYDSLGSEGQGRWLQGGMEWDMSYLKEYMENNYTDLGNFQEINLILFCIIFMKNLVIERFQTFVSPFV